jgi:hypothetical protein
VNVSKRAVWVDGALAPLLAAAWAAGIETLASYQGGQTRRANQLEGYILFHTADDVARFRTIVGPTLGVWNDTALRFPGDECSQITKAASNRLSGTRPTDFIPEQLRLDTWF